MNQNLNLPLRTKPVSNLIGLVSPVTPSQGILLVLLLLSLPVLVQSQSAIPIPDTLNKKRLNAVALTTGGLYAGSMTGLYMMWYRDYPQSSFHFHNDNRDWLLIDKLGHFTTAYQLGYYGYQMMRWTGATEKQSVWIGGNLGLFFLTTVEVFDGFSKEWGFSTGDFLANAFGSALFISQQLAWKEQRIWQKISFSRTQYAQYRPDLLGSTVLEEMLKDYNGHSFWLSVNPKSFLDKQSRFPGWLNIAFGYGAKGMTGSSSNPTEVDGQPMPHFRRTKQFYLSPDIDLTRIPTQNKTLKIVLGALNFIKVPMPTLEYNREDGLRFHALHF